MATVIKIKNSSVTAEPADNALAKGELAYSYNSNKLFVGQLVAGDIVATPIGGKSYTDLINTGTKTFTAAAVTNDNTITIQTTANNGDIVLTPHSSGLVKTDNLGFGGNTISSTDNDGDIVLTPNGNGLVKSDNLSFGGSIISSFSGTTSDDIDITLTPQAGGKVKTDNLSFDGSTIASFSGTTSDAVNITLNPQASGTVDVSSAKITSLGTPTANTDAATKHYVDTEVGNVSSTLTVSDGTTTDDFTTGSGNSLTIAGTANEITTAVTDESGSPTSSATVTIGLPDDVTITGDLAVNGDSITTDDATFNLINATATTINFGGAGTAIAIGAATGTTTINNGLEVTGVANLNNTTTSTTTGTGALVVDGGVGIAENLNVGGNTVITGDLTVNGTTTTVNTTTTTLQDPIITLGGGADNAAPTADDNFDRGVEFQWHNGTDAKVGFFGYDDSAEKFTFIADATNSSEVFSGTAGNVAFGDIDGANVSLTGSIGNYDGAAPTNGQLLIGNTTNGDFQAGTIAVTANTGLATPTLGAGTITLAGNNAGSTATVDPFREIVAGGSIEVGVSYEIITPGTSPSYTTDYAVNSGSNAAGGTFTRGTGEPVAPSDAVLLSRGGRSFSDDTTIVQADLAASAATNTSKGVASFASEQFNVNSGHVVVVEIDGGSF
jgi:hypothetical protein